MTDDELLATIDAHFDSGATGLTADQLIEHKERGQCWVCQAHRQLAAAGAHLARLRGADNTYSVKLTDRTDR